MLITRNAYYTLLAECVIVPPESGGILGGHDSVVTTVLFDENLIDLRYRNYSWSPNVSFLNDALERWESQGIEFLGIFHSHPSGKPNLSSPDENYIYRIMKSMPHRISRLYFPVVLPDVDVMTYAAERHDDTIRINADVTIVVTSMSQKETSSQRKEVN